MDDEGGTREREEDEGWVEEKEEAEEGGAWNFEYSLYFSARDQRHVSCNVSTPTEGKPTDFRVLLNLFACGLTAIVGISECALPVLELLPQLSGLRLRG